MNSKIINDLIKKYNIADPEIFGLNVKKALLGEVKPEDVGYNLHLALNLDLGPAVELATEIQFLSNKEKKDILADLNKSVTAKVDINQEINDLLIQNNINIGADLNDRFKKLVSSYLQDVRDEFEFKDSLMRSPKIAGIGLNNDEAENLISKLKAKKADWQKANVNLKPVFSGEPVQEADIDVAAKVRAPKVIAVPDEVTIDQILMQKVKSSGRPSQMPLSGAPSQTTQATPFVEDIKEEEEFLESTDELPAPAQVETPPAPAPRIIPPPAPIRPAENRQPLIRQTDQVSNRPQMSDVKFEPKLYGPLDELAAMSLADFRRLSKDPWQAIQKISGKLAILEGESMVRKNEGVQALRSSSLYNIYADIMNRALVEGKSFEQVITERGDINITEFKAIMELNKSLKY